MNSTTLQPIGLPPHIAETSSDMSDIHNSIFSAAVMTTRMPIILCDPNRDDCPICFANPAFLHMTGYQEKDLIGHNCRLLQGPDTDRESVSMIREAISQQKEIAVDILNYKKNRSSFWNALFISPVFDDEGKLIYFFASQLDITQRKDMADALRQSQKMEAVGQLTGGIAHDFNNLLTVISGFAELLEGNLNSDDFKLDRAKRAVTSIIQAADRGATLTAQLLAFARKQKLTGRVVNLVDLTERLLPLIQRSVGEGVNVVTQHAVPTCNARIDAVHAETAILNIANNARDAMDGRGTLTISTQLVEVEPQDTRFPRVEKGAYTLLQLADTGCGMDAETLDHITEPFFTTKEEGKGTGLGMAMVDGFIKQSGGTINIASKVGEGTTISMLFRQEVGPADATTVRMTGPLVGSREHKETVMVVDDNTEVADFATAVLTEFGYDVITVNSPQDALDRLRANGPVTLMFSDISMPSMMNGVQLAREVQSLYKETRILLATGFTNTSINITDANGIPFDLMSKPYKRADLSKRVRAAIDGPTGVS